MPTLREEVEEILLAAETAVEHGDMLMASLLLSYYNAALNAYFPKRSRQVFGSHVRFDAYSSEDVSDEQFSKLFLFSREEFFELDDALAPWIPHDLKASNGTKFSRTYGLQVTLLRLTNVFLFDEMSLILGSCAQTLSFIFQAMLDLLSTSLCGGLRRLDWVVPRMPLYRAGFMKKARQLDEESGTNFPLCSSVAFAIDGSDIPIARPSSAAFEGVNCQKVSFCNIYYYFFFFQTPTSSYSSFKPIASSTIQVPTRHTL